MLNKIFKKEVQDYKAKDLMTKHVITLQSQDNLLIAQRMMSRFRIKKIVVVVDDKNKKYPVGILTIKDIIKFLISDKADRDLNEIAIFEAMTKKLITTIKNEDVVDCAKILDKNNNISSLIVIEEEENSEQQEQQQESSVNKKISLSGIITSTDFTRFFSENCIGVASVKDYMSQPVFTISINEKVSKAIQLMLEKNVSRLVVTAMVSSHSSSSTLGILSETDISGITPALKSRKLRWVYENMELLFDSSKRNLDFIEPALVRIEDIFTPNPITIEKDADLAEAAKLMVKQGISGMPVIESSLVEGEEEGKMDKQPVGMISKTDIVRALTDIK